jgi:hypothetical protein
MENSLSEPHFPHPQNEDDTTRATARLPGLDIEIVHRRAPHAEQISVHLQAMPSFEAFGRFAESANPFAFWVEAARLAWLPWLSLNPLLNAWLGGTRGLLQPVQMDEAPPTIPQP